MTAQALFAQAAIITFLGAALVGALLMARRGAVAPLVIFGAIVLVGRACGFALNYFVSAEAGAPLAIQVLNYHARSVPIVVLAIYACLMQTRRYRVARDNDFIRALFRLIPYIYGGGFVIMVAWDLVVQPPILEYDKAFPVASWLVETAWFTTAAVYGGLTAFVFFGAIGGTAGPLGLGQRLQNLFFGIAFVGAGGSAPIAVAQRGIRAFFPEALAPSFVQPLAAAEFVAFVLTAAGIVLGIFSYYTQSKSDRFLERFSSFLELVGDLTEEISGAPISKEKLNFPYVTMYQAAGAEFLNLSLADKRKMDNAFRVRIVWKYRTGMGGGGEPWASRQAGGRTGRISRRRLRDLSEAYDAELKEPVLREGLSRGVCGQTLPDTLMDLLPKQTGGGDSDSHGRQGLGEALALALKTDVGGGGGRDLTSLPEWGQLVYVALADAGLLPVWQREATLDDDRGVSRKVLDTYRLAKFKVHNYGQGLPDLR